MIPTYKNMNSINNIWKSTKFRSIKSLTWDERIGTMRSSISNHLPIQIFKKKLIICFEFASVLAFLSLFSVCCFFASSVLWYFHSTVRVAKFKTSNALSLPRALFRRSILAKIAAPTKTKRCETFLIVFCEF